MKPRRGQAYGTKSFSVSFIICILLIFQGLTAWGTEKVGVAITSVTPKARDKYSDLDWHLYNYLGQVKGIQYVLKAENSQDFFDKLAHITKDGKKIDHLIILGHGSLEKPHITMPGQEDLEVEQFDIDELTKRINEQTSIITRAKKELCDLEFKKNLSDIEKSRKTSLEHMIKNKQKEWSRLTVYLERLEKIRDIMSENATILLLNCSAAGSEKGLKFVKLIGEAFLGMRGGKIIASKRDIEIDLVAGGLTDKSESMSTLNVIEQCAKWLCALVWAGQWVDPGDYYLAPKMAPWFAQIFGIGNWVTIPIPRREDSTVYLKKLNVDFEKSCNMVEKGESITLKTKVMTCSDSGRLSYFWEHRTQPSLDSNYSLDTRYDAEGRKKVNVKVRDERGREGEATAYILIKKPEYLIEVELSERPPKLHAPIHATACLVKGYLDPHTYWDWISTGGVKIRGKKGDQAQIAVSGRGLIIARLYRIGEFGKTHILAEKRLAIDPLDKEQRNVPAIGSEKTTSPKEKTETKKVKQEEWEQDKKDKNELKTIGSTHKSDIKRAVCANPTGVFPKVPFNDLQLRYGISGICIGPVRDSEGFTYSRSFDILGVTGETITVSGSSEAREAVCHSWAGSFWFQTDVSLRVGDQTKTWSSPKPCERESKEKYNVMQPAYNFSLSLPVPRDKSKVDVSVSIKQTFVNPRFGDRAVVVSGSGRQIQELAGVFPEGGQDGIPPSSLLKVSVEGPRQPIPIGQEVILKALMIGGTSPYSLQWSGAISGEGEYIRFTPPSSGEHVVNLRVTDSKGQAASASLVVKVESLQLELDGVPTQTPYGSQARLAVRFVGPAPQGVKYRFLWQASEPGIAFDPVESVNGETKVTFGRMGTIKLWAQVVSSRDGKILGETGQKQTKVQAPKFTIIFTPRDKQGRVGQEVRAKVAIEPEVPVQLIDYRWFEPVASNRMEYTENASEIGFKIKDDKPLDLKVLARVPYYGDEIAEITGKYTGINYEVKIGEPRAHGPRLQIWQCDTQLGGAKKCGMKDLPSDQYVTFQDLTLRAEVTPVPVAPRYQWTVFPSGSCGLTGIGDELKINCSSTGRYTVRLKILDADGLLLGQAERSVNISVSNEQIMQSPRSRSSQEKMQQAKQFVEQGKLDEAIALAGEAAQLDPKNMEASTLLNKWRKEKQTIYSQIDKVQHFLLQNKLHEAERELSLAQKMHPQYQPVILAEELLGKAKERLERAHRLVIGAGNLEKNKQYKEALQKYREAFDLIPTQEIQKSITHLEDLERQAIGLRREGFSLEKQGNIVEALKRFREAQTIFPEDGVERKIAELEQKNRQATQLIEEGHQAERSGRFTEAVAKYRQAYQSIPNQQIANRIAELEKTIHEQDMKRLKGKVTTQSPEVGTYTVPVEGGTLLPRPAGLVAWWPAEGNAKDIIGSRHGIMKNGAAFGPGMLGQAFKLDGVDDIVDLGGWNLGSRWTIEAWVNPLSKPPGRKTIAGGISECRDWGITMQNGEFGLVVRPPGGCTETIGSDVLAVPGTWYHVVGVSDGVIGRIFVNGKLKKSNFLEPNYIGTAQGTRIGGEECCPGNNFPGLIDEVRFYNRPLSEEEIAKSYNAGRMAMSGKIVRDERVPTGQTDVSDKVVTRPASPPTTQSGVAAPAGNLAFHKPARQSSTSQWSNANDAQGAVDGIKNGGYGFHTNKEPTPWWEVDLKAIYNLSEIRIFNRLDCCSERARTLQIFISIDEIRWKQIYAHDHSPFGGVNGKPLVVDLKGVSARYVRLQLNENTWFHLDEVEIYGTPFSTYTSPSKKGSYYQLDFKNHYTHNRFEPAIIIDGVPLAGGPITWLSIGTAAEGNRYPSEYMWPVPNFRSSAMIMATNLSWWGDAFKGETIARITVFGREGESRSFNIVAGKHTAEWNGGRVSGSSPEVRVYENAPGPCSRWFINRFEIGSMLVNRVKVNLFKAATWGGKSGVFEIHGITLVGMDSEN